MKRYNFEMKRTNSICPKPEEQLLDYARENNIFFINELIKNNHKLLRHEYGHPFYKTIVQIACSNFANSITQQTVETLINLGADLYYHKESNQGKETLHFAALSDNEQILKTICKHIEKNDPVRINSTADGDTALLVLIKEGEENNGNFVNCAKVLIEYGLDINKPDKKNISPVLYAAKNGYKALTKLLVEQDNIDLDSHILRKKSARDWIREKNLYDGDLPPPNTNNNPSKQDELFAFIRSGDEESFVQQKDTENYVNIDNGEETLLQMSCRKHLSSAVQYLIDRGVETNRVTDKTKDTALEIAAKRGYFEIVNILLSDGNTHIKDVLSLILKKMDQPKSQKVNYSKCFDVLISKRGADGLNINKRDADGNFPLHYAARYSDPKTSLTLLRKGASLGNENVFGRLPLGDMEAETLEKHFDECITADRGKIDSNEFTVTFSYRTLLPKQPSPRYEPDIERGKATDSALIRKERENLISEMKVISELAVNPEHKQLLKHPLVTSFLYLKWHRICYFFYANLALYIAVWISLTPYIFLSYNNSNYENESGTLKAFANILQIIVAVTFVFLLLKEMFQIIVSPNTYFLQFDNWIELSLIITMAIILLQSSPDNNTKKQVSAVAILVSAIQLLLLIGQHPKMSISIIMLRTVSYNFFKFFLWHSILILAFALSFYTLFNNHNEVGTKNLTLSEENDAFDDPGASLFKTFIMLTGEFDASDINFDTFPIISRILFIIFIFMIAIVLFNLLNGLAVSDTQLIQNDAKIFAYTGRVQHICYIENMLLGSLLPSKVIKCFERICCCFPGFDKKFTLPIMISENACLFPNYLENNELNIYLNREGEVIWSKEKKIQIKKSAVRLDKISVKNAKHLLRDRFKEERNGPDDIVQKLVKLIELQHKQIEETQNLIEKTQKQVEVQQVQIEHQQNEILTRKNVA